MTSPVTDFSSLTAQTTITNSGYTLGAEVTCDTTKWASATACDGVTRWALNTGTAATYVLANVAATSNVLGSKRAWLWLADQNPTTPASVFGVEKDDIINITIAQTAANVCEGAAAAVAAGATKTNTHKNARQYEWGAATFTHAGAQSAYLGAAALITGVIALF